MKAYATIGQEPYTGFDDVLIPEPALAYDANQGQHQPWEMSSERFFFSAVADAHVETPDNGGMELSTNVYLSHEEEDRHTTPQQRAEAWIKKIAAIPMSDYKLIEQGTVKLPGVPAVPATHPIEPYRLTLETNGLGVKDYLGNENYYKDEHYIQRFYLLPISRDEVVTVRSIRNKEDDFPNTQFSAQWDHFLKTLTREVANTRSTTEGSAPRTRRYFTHAFSFEIFTRDAKGGDQWVNEYGAERSEVWHTPQGVIGFSISIHSHKDYFNVGEENENIKVIAKGKVEGLPGIARQYHEPVPVMTYIEKPLGTATFYGYREETEDQRSNKKIDDPSVDMSFETVYTPGKKIAISFSGRKSAIDANEKLIYDWFARFKFLP